MSHAKKHAYFVVFCFTVAFSSWTAVAQERRGFNFNNLSVSPFINVEYIYDSNVESDKRGEKDDTIVRVNPGVDITYSGNNWGLKGNGWFSDDRYHKYDDLNELRYGESLGFYADSEKGLHFEINQRYVKSSQDDQRIANEARWRDRDELSLDSALSYQVSEKTSVTLSGSYDRLEYDNNPTKYSSDLYGSTRWTMGLELARRITEKSNLLLSGEYLIYKSDGGVTSANLDATSTGYSVMAGFGSAATKKIRYRVLTGATFFEFADSKQLTGWTYSLDATWAINQKLALTVVGSSFFQPSESTQNQAEQIYALSAGMTYRPTRKLSARFDLMGRREETSYNVNGANATPTEHILSFRARVDYELARYITLYSGLEYLTKMSDGANETEYDRYRGSLGLNLRY